MLKANINLIKEFYERPIAMYYLYRDEEGRTPLREGLVRFLSEGSLSPGGFREWITTTFSSAQNPAEPEFVTHPYIYFDQRGRRSACTIVIDLTHDEILIDHWERCILRADRATTLRQLRATLSR